MKEFKTKKKVISDIMSILEEEIDINTLLMEDSKGLAKSTKDNITKEFLLTKSEEYSAIVFELKELKKRINKCL